MIKHISLTLLVTLMCCLWAGSSYADKGESKAKEDDVSILCYRTCPDCKGEGSKWLFVFPVICDRCGGTGKVISWEDTIMVVVCLVGCGLVLLLVLRLIYSVISRLISDQ